MSVTRLILNCLMNIDLHPVFGDKHVTWCAVLILELQWNYNGIERKNKKKTKG